MHFLLYPCNDLPIDESVEFERRKKNTKQNRAKSVANKSERSNETRGADPDMRAPMKEQEPDPEKEQDKAADNVQKAIKKREAEPDQGEQDQVNNNRQRSRSRHPTTS